MLKEQQLGGGNLSRSYWKIKKIPPSQPKTAKGDCPNARRIKV